MKRLIGWLAFGVIASAHAHAHLQTSTPADGSVLQQSPMTFALKFDEPATLTVLTLQKEGGPPQKMAAPATPTAQLSIPAPKLDAGSYTLSYKALSADNHVVAGQIHFKIAH